MKPLVLISCCLALFSYQATLQGSEDLSKEESFFLRRVTEFWKDQNYNLAKKQITAFLQAHPHSSLTCSLHALLGDIAYCENQFATALVHYEKVFDEKIYQAVMSKKTECLYLVGYYPDAVITAKQALHLPSQAEASQQKLYWITGQSLIAQMKEEKENSLIKQYALEAKAFLAKIDYEPYQTHVLASLVDVYITLDDHFMAIQSCIRLSKIDSQKKELWLVKALSLAKKTDPKLALTLARDIYSLNQSYATSAYFDELCLLFEEKSYDQIIANQNHFEDHLTQTHAAYLHYYLCQSYFFTHQYHEAIYHGRIYLEKTKTDERYHNQVYFTLLSSLIQSGDDMLFNETFNTCHNRYLDGPTLETLLLAKVTSNLKNQLYFEAEQGLIKVRQIFPHLLEKESFIYPYASFLLETHQWEESRNQWKNLLQISSQKSVMTSALQAIIECSLQQRYQSTDLSCQKQLAADLLQAQPYFPDFPQQSAAICQFFLGKTLFELNRYAEASSALEQFCSVYTDHHFQKNARTLWAFSLEKISAPVEKKIAVFQKALESTDDKDHQSFFHYGLFTSFLEKNMHDQAAYHLQKAVDDAYHAVEIHDTRWLANYYIQQLSANFTLHLKEQVSSLLKKILQVKDDLCINFDPNVINLEQEALHLASLLPIEEKNRVLSSLVTLHSRFDFTWSLQAHALFELAKTAIQLNQDDQALSHLDAIKKYESTLPEAFVHQIKREKSSILLKNITSFPEESEEVDTLLTLLKDLQIQKNITQEPLHLESALSYMDVRLFFTEKPIKARSAAFFLHRIQEDFHPYLERKEHALSAKETVQPVIDLYFQVIEAEIQMWQALESGDKTHKKEVLATFSQLLYDDHATPYIQNRIHTHMNLIQE